MQPELSENTRRKRVCRVALASRSALSFAALLQAGKLGGITALTIYFRSFPPTAELS